MSVREHFLHLAASLEIIVNQYHDKHYFSERSRNKDIIAAFKKIVRAEMTSIADKPEQQLVYSVGGLLNNRFLDEMTPAEFSRYLKLLICVLKNDTPNDNQLADFYEQYMTWKRYHFSRAGQKVYM